MKAPLIVHICLRKEWEAAQRQGSYRPLSLEAEGFIHCSRAEQVLPVANAFYRGRAELVLLWIAPGKVSPEIRWEPVEEAVYPHIYGPLNLEAVEQVSNFSPDPDGIFRSL